ncbi:MAG TPA: hypothetical protein VK723_05390, partial [Thermoplasmata archaeon]|nr:hypothetical protein [Thermoplasmata archaeon]
MSLGGTGPAAPTPCPASTAQFGDQFHDGGCTIRADTTWANGRFVLRGNLTVRSGIRLTLENLTLLLDPATEQQWRIYVDGGELVMRGGSLGSNTTRHWRLETSATTQGRIDLTGANVSRAGANGGGPYSAFLLAGGNHHRFANLTVTDSALNADWHHAVISSWSEGIT